MVIRASQVGGAQYLTLQKIIFHIQFMPRFLVHLCQKNIIIIIIIITK
jgi:hypothetical protein